MYANKRLARHFRDPHIWWGSYAEPIAPTLWTLTNLISKRQAHQVGDPYVRSEACGFV